MASLPHFLFLCLVLVLHSVVLIECGQEDRYLLLGVNLYRASSGLLPLNESRRADCLADEVADRLSETPCPTGSNTVRPQFLDYPDLLETCHFNVTTARNGQILTSCVRNLEDPGQVLSQITTPQNSRYLNDSQFTLVGLGHNHDWAVVVLTMGPHEASDTPGYYLGDFVDIGAPNGAPWYLRNSSNRTSSAASFSRMVFLFLSFLTMMY